MPAYMPRTRRPPPLHAVLLAARQVGGAIYFVSFIIVNAMILFNVVVAVLLDKCMNHDINATEDADDDGIDSGLSEREEPEPDMALASAEQPPPMSAIRSVPMSRHNTPAFLSRHSTQYLSGHINRKYMSGPNTAELLSRQGMTSGLRGSNRNFTASLCNLRLSESSSPVVPVAPSTYETEEANAKLANLCTSVGMLRNQLAIVLSAINDNQMRLDSLCTEISSSTLP